MTRGPSQPPLLPEERYRMRRLSEPEMIRLRRLARDGRKGPKRALDALWDLILREAEGVGLAEASQRERSFRVQDFAIPRAKRKRSSQR